MDVTADLPDATLWERAGDGDGEAFGQLGSDRSPG